MIFADTSAFIALLNGDDRYHSAATDTWLRLTQEPGELMTTNYVVLETISLLQRRIGLNAVRDFLSSLLPLLQVDYVDAPLHEAAINFMLAQDRRHLSLVDSVSFIFMRRMGMTHVFGYDGDFVRFGFEATIEKQSD